MIDNPDLRCGGGRLALHGPLPARRAAIRRAEGKFIVFTFNTYILRL